MEPAPDQGIRATRFGRYEALLRIGRGGMAEVYAGRVRGEAGFQKLVAVKRMLPHLADDEKFASMFLDEARLAANISSPHVVSTLDLGRSDDGALYLVMELIVGVTLSSLLRNAAREGVMIPVGVSVEVLAQSAQGLHDAHEARTPAGTPLGIVHRDVSPQNVLIGADGRARITDFGVARAMLRRTDTTTGELKGKLAYFSPEQISDDSIDRRSDVFALGIVAWETFTGRRLFKAENPLALLDRIANMPIPPISRFNPEVPDDVNDVVQKCLVRDREQRYGNCQDFANDLRRAAFKHLPLPDRSELAAFVQKAAGERLSRLEESIRVALDDEKHTPVPKAESAFPEQGSGVTMRSDKSNPHASNPSTRPLRGKDLKPSKPSPNTGKWAGQGSAPSTNVAKPSRSTQPLEPSKTRPGGRATDEQTAQSAPAFVRDSEDPGPEEAGEDGPTTSLGSPEEVLAAAGITGSGSSSKKQPPREEDGPTMLMEGDVESIISQAHELSTGDLITADGDDAQLGADDFGGDDDNDATVQAAPSLLPVGMMSSGSTASGSVAPPGGAALPSSEDAGDTENDDTASDETKPTVDGPEPPLDIPTMISTGEGDDGEVVQTMITQAEGGFSNPPQPFSSAPPGYVPPPVGYAPPPGGFATPNPSVAFAGTPPPASQITGQTPADAKKKMMIRSGIIAAVMLAIFVGGFVYWRGQKAEEARQIQITTELDKINAEVSKLAKGVSELHRSTRVPPDQPPQIQALMIDLAGRPKQARELQEANNALFAKPGKRTAADLESSKKQLAQLRELEESTRKLVDEIQTKVALAKSQANKEAAQKMLKEAKDTQESIKRSVDEAMGHAEEARKAARTSAGRRAADDAEAAAKQAQKALAYANRLLARIDTALAANEVSKATADANEIRSIAEKVEGFEEDAKAAADKAESSKPVRRTPKRRPKKKKTRGIVPEF